MSPTKKSIITSYTHKTGSTGPSSIFKVYLKYNFTRILMMCHSLDIVYNPSIIGVDKKALETLTDDVAKYYNSSTLISSSIKKTFDTLLSSQTLSLTISHKDNEIIIAQGKMLHTLISKLITVES